MRSSPSAERSCLSSWVISRSLGFSPSGCEWLCGFPDGVVLLKVAAQGEHGRRMNLTDARLGDAEHFGNFVQAEILKIIEREHLALHFGKMLQATDDEI